MARMSDQDGPLNAVLLRALASSEGAVKDAHPALIAAIKAHARRRTELVLNSEDLVENKDRVIQSAVAYLYKYIQAIPLAVWDLPFVHDIWISSSASPETPSLATLTLKLFDILFSRKPSLLRAIQTQLLPGYIDTLAKQSLTIPACAIIVRSMANILEIEQVKEAVTHSEAAAPFWVALQTLYDETLPNLLVPAGETQFPSTSVLDIPGIKTYTDVRLRLLRVLEAHFAALNGDSLLALLEGEASDRELPAVITQLPLTSLLNLSFLADAQYRYSISEAASRKDSSQESLYVSKTIAGIVDASETVEDALDSLLNQKTTSAKRKGKGRATETTDSIRSRSNAREVAASTSRQAESSDPSQEAGLVQQVLAILPDTAPERITQLLLDPALAGLSAQEKVERLIQKLLEPEALRAENTKSASREDETSSAGKSNKSAFAAQRRNIFDDRMDVSKLRFGKEDISNDPFLPATLKEAILSAAAAQEAEELSDEEELASYGFGSAGATAKSRTAAFVEDFGDTDNEGNASRIKVKDNIDEESEAEEEEERMQSGVSRPTASTSSGHTPLSSPSGLSQVVEQQLLAAYAKEPALFATSARKMPARADLKKALNGLSDEQIEGWARMLERNPKKDKLIAATQEFRGNEKGLQVQSGRSSHAKRLTPGKAIPRTEGSAEVTQADKASQGQSTDSGGRGRGRGRGQSKGNRGHQGEQRRRGHDKKMAKSGL